MCYVMRLQNPIGLDDFKLLLLLSGWSLHSLATAIMSRRWIGSFGSDSKRLHLFFCLQWQIADYFVYHKYITFICLSKEVMLFIFIVHGRVLTCKCGAQWWAHYQYTYHRGRYFCLFNLDMPRVIMSIYGSCVQIATAYGIYSLINSEFPSTDGIKCAIPIFMEKKRLSHEGHLRK
jgi:hypothetical protein